MDCINSKSLAGQFPPPSLTGGLSASSFNHQKDISQKLNRQFSMQHILSSWCATSNFGIDTTNSQTIS
ncbi:hypothetical protein PoMZ_11115 [Pyricularia oryzae]|uniref:Uncharacterized protein n=1 Tax=Pyricularia oryzae TaxID=318829 RepID=A0A4V1C758_PYROR|nr:hypothetical protein PoMZ_11115 [Pyricularia oryzae]